MKRIFVLGTLLAVFTFLAVVLGSWAQLGLDNVLFATGCGALLGLIPNKGPGVRIGAFFLGFVIGVLGYLFRAAVLPDSVIAQGIAAFIGIMIVTLICGLTRGRLPFWAAILGLIAITGAYNATFTAAPYDFIQSALATTGSLVLCAGVGMLAIVIGQFFVGPEENDEPASTQPSPTTSEPTVASERPIVNVNG